MATPTTLPGPSALAASAAASAESAPPESPRTTFLKPTRWTSLRRKPTRIDSTRDALISSSPLSSGSASVLVGTVGALIPDPLQLTKRELDLLVAEPGGRQALALHLAQAHLGPHQ